MVMSNRGTAWWAATEQGVALHRHRVRVKALVNAYGFRNPCCFGSVATGTAGADSDIDLIVESGSQRFDPAVLDRLADELGTIVRFPVDVITWEFAHDNVRRAATRQAKKI